ncbi:aldose 1-epimerase family protein [Herbihabitans rhizosphaerae]|nr:aldose 1-epimerase family protein [Herbihabitans rhizosphaerae]
MEYEIRRGAARAVITSRGGGLRAFDVAGVSYVDGYGPGESPPMGAGAVLVPWPNRVAGAVWARDGERHELEVTEPARGNANHGLVRKRAWSLVAHDASAVTLEISVEPVPGWPFPFRTTVSYALDERGLTITHGVHNLGERPLPFGVGAHPYPRPGDADPDDCVLTLAASTHLPLDPERMVPSGPAVPVDGTGLDFRTGRPLRGVTLDHAFGGCVPDGQGLVRHSLGDVSVWADPVFSWVQVYTPDSFPGKGSTRAVAIEPMTCPPDALNSGTDLITLAPGESWTGRWGITPV